MQQRSWMIALTLLTMGCHKDEVQVYQSAKEKSTPAEPAPPSRAESSPKAGHEPWTAPKEWAVKPTAGGMRLASYGVTGPDGRSVDISLVALGEQAGTELANVNRWRKELQLADIEEAQLASSSEPVRIGTAPGFLYDMTSTALMLEGKYKRRTLASILPAGGMTVFFKATGDAELVGQEKARFIAWLASVQNGPNDSSASAPSTASAPPPVSPAANPPPSVPDGPQSDLPKWKAPAHWKPAGPKPMRLASFDIPGKDGAGDVSVSTLSGSGGGPVANVNRWRGMVGLAPLDEAGLAKESTALTLAGGRKGILVNLGGSSPKRILAAIVPDGDHTWFFRLTAPDALASAELKNFTDWVQSVEF